MAANMRSRLIQVCDELRKLSPELMQITDTCRPAAPPSRRQE
jgi:hypothetical protein